MLTEEIADPDAITPADLRAEYERRLAAVVETVGVDEVGDGTGIDRARLDALVAGESPPITVEEAAAVLSLSDAYPDAERILLELRDHVMLQMSSAVLDVDAVESGIDADLDARDVQQKIEGRQPMTLAEYAEIHRFIAAENPF